MTKAARVARRLLLDLDLCNFAQVEDYIFVYTCPFIANGVFVERTPYKDTYYARTLLLPLFTSNCIFTLNYSERFGNTTSPTYTQSFEGSPDQVASQLGASIRALEIVEQVQRPYGPEDFIHTYGHGDVRRLPDGYRKFDLAAATALSGDYQTAGACFRDLDEAYAARLAAGLHTPPLLHLLGSRSRECRTALDESPQTLRAYLLALVASNAHALGFDPPPPPDGQGAHPPDSPG